MDSSCAKRLAWLFAALVIALQIGCSASQRTDGGSHGSASAVESLPDYIRANYHKHEHEIQMRDGVKLFTVVYVPNDTSATYPIMLMRTPYGIGPYGPEAYKDSLGPGELFARDGFIFAYQDVRGRYMSEGEFVNMRPHIKHKHAATDIDESTDTWDTVDWLVKNVANNNGRVGMWGISYPGFYCSAGMIDAHPALRAVSPQAPIADWYFDDFHHHGAFFLPHNFNFMAAFGRPRPKPVTDGWQRFDHGTPDGYQFFYDMGPLKNADLKYFKGEVAFWNEVMEHPDYDEFWQSRNILPHLNNVAPAVMTVGGWYDAEDLYGAIKTYQAIETQNGGVFNMLVMGPWIHGGWSRNDGDRLGNISFGVRTSLFYRPNIEFVFFN
jgi:putative CocE/NonD family hydrolase